ncbi:hypothetical protein J6590_064265 [Homalodisca vitripennis]|nr:hypothetical protein J6590_064265 [Homalodisca vitripennis]
MRQFVRCFGEIAFYIVCPDSCSRAGFYSRVVISTYSYFYLTRALTANAYSPYRAPLLESTSHNEVSRQTLLLESTSHHDTASRSCAETRFRQSVGRRCSDHIGAPATALPRVERFPNLKLTPSNGRTTTTTTIDENKSTHLFVKINVFSFKNKKTGYKIEPLQVYNRYRKDLKNFKDKFLLRPQLRKRGGSLNGKVCNRIIELLQNKMSSMSSCMFNEDPPLS